MKTDRRKVDPGIVQEAAKILENRFGAKIKIGSTSLLSEPDRRNVLIRITLDNLSGALPKSAIIKQSLDEKSDVDEQGSLGRFARDWAGLGLLGELDANPPLVPKLYGGSAKHRFIVIEDLGEIHQSLVDALTGADRVHAEAALERYIKALGLLHGISHQHVNNYLAIFKKLNPTGTVWHDNQTDLIAKLLVTFKKINLPLNDEVTREIENVYKIVQEPGPLTTLIHGDICPDNVFDNPINGHMRIIDFEWSLVGNALLDGVYMRMCMPTCWCAKAFPEEVIEKFELLYRTELSKSIPAAKIDKIYMESYVAACAYWMLWHVSSVQDIWEKDTDLSDKKYSKLHPNWRPEDSIRRPRVLYRIQAFIAVAKKHEALPHLRSMAEQVLAELKSIWPATKPLKLYPAFI